MNNSNSDFTQGSIIKKLITFVIPILGALILQAAYGAVDLMVVGRFGTTSAAVFLRNTRTRTAYCCTNARR